MKIFVTGATGFFGSVVVQELLQAGHEVTGLARSQTSNFVENCKADGRVIRAMGEGLVQSKGFIVITSGLFVVEPSSDSTPDELVPVQAGAHPRSETEVAGADVAAKGVRVVVVRLPLVYGREDHAGFTSLLISIARQKQESAYISDGEYLWPAVHQLDAAVLFRLVVDNATEDGPAHAVAEEGVLLREIAEVVGKRLNIPVVSKSVTEANEHFGWLARFMHNDKPRSSQWTQEKYAGSPSKLVYSPFSTAMLTFHDLDSLMALANTFLNRNNDWELILGKVLTTGTAALDFDNLL